MKNLYILLVSITKIGAVNDGCYQRWMLSKMGELTLLHIWLSVNMDFRFHDLRHTFATHFLRNTKDFRALQEILGHSDYRMTLRYSHVLDDHKREAMEAFERGGKQGLIHSLLHTRTSTRNIQEGGGCCRVSLHVRFREIYFTLKQVNIPKPF